jgi:hypothetical protein
MLLLLISEDINREFILGSNSLKYLSILSQKLNHILWISSGLLNLIKTKILKWIINTRTGIDFVNVYILYHVVIFG